MPGCKQHRKTNVSQAQTEKQSLSELKPIDSDDNHRNHEEEMDDDENRRVSLQDLPMFCDRLEKFIKHVRNIQDLRFLTYDYPEIVNNRFENDVYELESMLKEINAALTNINRQKAQRSLIKKEKTVIKKTLNRIKDDEFREMENVVAMYDKALFSRWESLKTTHKPEALKSLLMDIKCKQLALENLDKLVTQKLGNLTAFSSFVVNGHDKSEKEKSVIPLPFLPICPTTTNERKSKIPLPPPLPPPPTLASRNKAQSLSMQRRRRLEREEQSFDSLYSVARDIDIIDLPVIPLTFDNIPDNLIVGLNGNSHREVVSASYISSNSVGPQGGLTTDLQQEMGTVLQALFGDLRNRDFPPMVTDSSSSDKMDEAASKNIELLPLSESNKDE